MQGVFIFVFMLTLESICVCGIQKAIGLSPCKENQSRKLFWALCTLENTIAN